MIRLHGILLRALPHVRLASVSSMGRTNPTGRLINHFNKGCARPRYTTFDNISPTDYSTHKQ